MGKKDILKGKTETQVWRSQGNVCLNPTQLNTKLADTSGATLSQSTLMMKTLAIVFHSELEKVGSFFVPGVGLFQSVYTPPMPGRMKSVCGALRAIPPQPSKTSVEFTPFKEVVDLLSDTKRRLEGPGERAGGSASAEAPAGLVDLNSPEQHSSSDGEAALKDVQPQTPK